MVSYAVRHNHPFAGRSRANRLRNPGMLGAVAGTPGTNPTKTTIAAAPANLTKQIVAASPFQVQFGASTTGTAANSSSLTALVTFESNTNPQAPASLGQTWQAIADVALLAGGVNFASITSLVLRARFQDSAGTQLQVADTSLLGITSTPRQFSVSITATSLQTAFANMSILGQFVNATSYCLPLQITNPRLIRVN